MRERSTLALAVIFKEAQMKWEEPKPFVNSPDKEARGRNPYGVWHVPCTGEANLKKSGKG